MIGVSGRSLWVVLVKLSEEGVMEIAFLFQGEEIYRVELPDNTERATFEFVESAVYDKVMIPIPVVSEVVLRSA